MTDTSNLEKSTELCIGALSQIILDDVAQYRDLQGKEPQILAQIAELKMDVRFILMDLAASYVASCKVSEPYAIRFHIQNLEAGMHEAYKLLHGYGNSTKYRAWTKIGKELNDKTVIDWGEYPQFSTDYYSIEGKLKNLEGDEVDKQHRELTYHYNVDMRRVYAYKVSIKDHEEASLKLISYMEVLSGILKFCDNLEEKLKEKGISPAVKSDSSSLDDNLHLVLIQFLSKNKELSIALSGILNDVRPLDEYVRHLENIDKLNEIADGQVKVPEIDNVAVMLNLYLTVLFMRADMAATTQAFLQSKTSGEAMLNMRRYVITITAACGHLYGYSEAERTISIWNSALAMIPVDCKALQEESDDIGILLQKVVLKEDMDVRTIYAHLFNNKTNRTNIPEIVEQLKNQNPVLEMGKVSIMLQVIKLVMDFIMKLMEELAVRAHEANEQSTAQLRETMNRIKSVADDPNCPGKAKDMLIGFIGKVCGWTGIEL